jgi:hypothetical protein
MELQERISRQRIYHIIDSYQLLGSPPIPAELDHKFSQLLSNYSQEVLELAIANCVAKAWTQLPMPRGQAFLDLLTEHLNNQLPNQLTPQQFQQITGLEMPPHLTDALTQVRME